MHSRWPRPSSTCSAERTSASDVNRSCGDSGDRVARQQQMVPFGMNIHCFRKWRLPYSAASYNPFVVPQIYCDRENSPCIRVIILASTLSLALPFSSAQSETREWHWIVHASGHCQSMDISADFAIRLRAIVDSSRSEQYLSRVEVSVDSTAFALGRAHVEGSIMLGLTTVRLGLLNRSQFDTRIRLRWPPARERSSRFTEDVMSLAVSKRLVISLWPTMVVHGNGCPFGRVELIASLDRVAQ